MELPATKSQIDKAGRFLSSPLEDFDENYLNEFAKLEGVFDKYRETHLQPLTELTTCIQTELQGTSENYYIAQRLKRKPQILRKLNRLSVRLTQLQDIGGLRIIVNNNDDVDRIAQATEKLIKNHPVVGSIRDTDYRPEGRDDSGYRALHKIVSYGPLHLEVQIRSIAQHYWAESVERTSVFYGKRLKEGEGSSVVQLYFKAGDLTPRNPRPVPVLRQPLVHQHRAQAFAVAVQFAQGSAVAVGVG